MAEHTVKIRPAEPTFDEGLVFAKYLDEAFEGFFRRLLGRQVANIVAEAFVQPNHAFSHRHALFGVSIDCETTEESALTCHRYGTIRC